MIGKRISIEEVDDPEYSKHCVTVIMRSESTGSNPLYGFYVIRKDMEEDKYYLDTLAFQSSIINRRFYRTRRSLMENLPQIGMHSYKIYTYKNTADQFIHFATIIKDIKKRKELGI